MKNKKPLLKPCTCGGRALAEPVPAAGKDDANWTVRCPKCGKLIFGYTKLGDAVKAWNNRENEKARWRV